MNKPRPPFPPAPPPPGAQAMCPADPPMLPGIIEDWVLVAIYPMQLPPNVVEGYWIGAVERKAIEAERMGEAPVIGALSLWAAGTGVLAIRRAFKYELRMSPTADGQPEMKPVIANIGDVCITTQAIDHAVRLPVNSPLYQYIAQTMSKILRPVSSAPPPDLHV
jgi:hypothetical protein